jgi:hypothetical protein
MQTSRHRKKTKHKTVVKILARKSRQVPSNRLPNRSPSAHIQRPNSMQATCIHLYHSPHSSSFFPPLPPLFLTALVPMPLGFFLSIPPAALVSPALENSSQKSSLSFAGPFGAAPKLSQKSLRSGSALRRPEVAGFVEEAESPSTKRLNWVPAFTTPDWRVWPRVPAVVRAWEAMSASASCGVVSPHAVYQSCAIKVKRHTFCMPGFTQPSYPVLPTLLTLAPSHPNPFVSAATGSFWKSSRAGGAPGSSSFFQ